MALQLPTICEIVLVYCCFYMLVGHLGLHAVVMVMCVYFVVLLILLIAPVCYRLCFVMIYTSGDCTVAEYTLQFAVTQLA